MTANQRSSDALPTLPDVRTFYRSGVEVTVTALPAGTARVVASRVTGEVVEAVTTDHARFAGLASGTYVIEAYDSDGVLLADELTTVGEHQGERPVHGFATSFGEDDIAAVVEWNRELRSTVVQVYDWMESYTKPLGPESGWIDTSNRPVSFKGLRSMASGLNELGAVTHAYAPIYAVGNEFATEHPEMLLYRGDGETIRFLDQIVLANPANVDWQRHFLAAYGEAADAVGFKGFHIDTYGYPRIAHDSEGKPVDMRSAYESFLDFIRAARPDDLISFNQVNGVPSAAWLPEGPRFRYCEIWPPNEEWRHFEGLLERSSGRAGLNFETARVEVTRGSIACYPPVWGIDQSGGPVVGAAREASLRTDVCTEAIVTCLGASSLTFGDKTAALCDPYYPKHARLSADEGATVIRWRRFALRCRDLFVEGEDTSWCEIHDENGSVSVEADVPVRPEPVGGSLFARVVLGRDRIIVGVLDLTGSVHGRWSEPTEKGVATMVTIRVLVDLPQDWRVDAAVLGAAADRFSPIEARDVAHRQGRALEVHVPLVDGWSVLRAVRRELKHDA